MIEEYQAEWDIEELKERLVLEGPWDLQDHLAIKEYQDLLV